MPPPAAPSTQPVPAAPQASPATSSTNAREIDVTAPAPLPPVSREYRVHQGFYARGSMGVGPLFATFDDGSLMTTDLDGAGVAFDFDLLLGGAPVSGLFVGGALLSSAAFSAKFERMGERSDRDASQGVLGLFVDGFLNANDGWHLGGAFGLAQIKVRSQLGDQGSGTMHGFGGAAWLGHDFWVADAWSMGGLLRFAGSVTSAKENAVETGASAFSTAFMFTTLYN